MGFKMMHFERDYYQSFDSENHNRYFWWPFRKRKAGKTDLRPGAMMPEVVKQKIKQIGIDKQVEIIRIGYDGEIEDMPILVEIISINDSGFTGKIVNLEREMIEKSTEKLVYAKKGGGIIEFKYNDGDIKEIVESKDEELLEQEVNSAAIQEMLSALEVNDHIMVAYFDSEEHGTLNAEGTLLEKNEDNTEFTIQIEKINKIELEKKNRKTFDVNKDLVIDIEIL